jgi:hypothetical protein
MGHKAASVDGGLEARFLTAANSWALAVHGKGARNRVAAVPGEAPVVVSADDPTAAVGYRALYASVESWFQRAIRAAPGLFCGVDWRFDVYRCRHGRCDAYATPVVAMQLLPAAAHALRAP